MESNINTRFNIAAYVEQHKQQFLVNDEAIKAWLKDITFDVTENKNLSDDLWDCLKNAIDATPQRVDATHHTIVTYLPDGEMKNTLRLNDTKPYDLPFSFEQINANIRAHEVFVECFEDNPYFGNSSIGFIADPRGFRLTITIRK